MNALFYAILYVFRFLTFWGVNPSKFTGYADVAMINPFTLSVLSLPRGYPMPRRLRAHERKHIEQVKRDGKIKFMFLYLCRNIRYGYKNNPYEVEAREAENE
jgi:hypothetical protein